MHWEESSVKIDHATSLKEGDTYDENEAISLEIPPNPPWIPDNAETLAWEQDRESQIQTMRKDPTYKFVMLLSGFTNEKISKYWTRNESASKRAQENPTCGLEPEACNVNGNANREAKKYHDWYVNTSWADGMIYLTPMVFAHMEETLTALTQKFEHLRMARLEHFIESPRVRSLFARLVAMCIRITDVLSGKKYHLDSTYRRVHMERQRLMNTFKRIHLVKKDLTMTEIQELANRNEQWRLYVLQFKNESDTSSLRGYGLSNELVRLNQPTFQRYSENRLKYLN